MTLDDFSAEIRDKTTDGRACGCSCRPIPEGRTDGVLQVKGPWLATDAKFEEAVIDPTKVDQFAHLIEYGGFRGNRRSGEPYQCMVWIFYPVILKEPEAIEESAVHRSDARS